MAESRKDKDQSGALQDLSPEATLLPAAGEDKPRKHYDIDIYRAWCKECGLCAAFCPKGCLEMDANGRPQIAHPERCTGCGWCELHCPDFAISVRECPQALPKEEVD